jgi:sialic acid synthase SpsE
MIINGFDTSKKVMVIAEIGNNHEGSFDTAVKMVEAAAEAGANAVKFQTFKTEFFINPSNKERFEKLKSFELTFSQFESLSKIAREKGLIFISTPFDLQSATFLNGIVDAFKIASSDNTFYPLIEYVASTDKPAIASTGLANLEEIEKLKSLMNGEFALLHCVSAYPVPEDEINLSYIGKLKRHFNCSVGYSDHSLGIEVAPLSVAAGSEIVEKHFTLDKNFSDFRDHQLSADPEDLRKMIYEIRKVESIMGNGSDIMDSEKLNLTLIRRAVVAARDLPTGHKLTEEDLLWIRQEGGSPPGTEKIILGRKLTKAMNKYDIFTKDKIV